MTISSTIRKAGPFSGTGAQTAFPFAFKVFDTTDLRVVLTDTTGLEVDQALTSQYTVALNIDQNANAGGTVTMLAAPPTGYKLTLTSAVPSTQGQSIPNNGGFYPKVIENAYDKVTILIQQLAEQVGRSVKFAISDTSTGNNMPPAAQRANNLLGFDANGNMIAVAPTAGTATALQSLLGTIAGSSLVGFIQAGIGAVLRTVQDKLRESVSVKDFGAKGDWNGTTGTDDAAAFQAAIDYVAGKGGGVVHIPPVAVAYRLDQKITVKIGVRLIGETSRPAIDWYQATLAGYYGGTCLAITWGVGTLESMAIEVTANTSVGGFTVVYPGQVADLTVAQPLDFPPTIAGNEGTSPGGCIENINFVNSRKAVYLPYGHGELTLRSLWGTPLGEFITLNGVYNADQLIDINVSGIFYLRSSAAANFTNNTGLWSWIQKNGRAFVIGYADAIRFTDCFVGNCYAGLYFGNAPKPGGSAALTQFAYGSWTGGGWEGVTFPIFVDGSTTGGINSNGFRVSDAGFAPVALFNGDRSVSILLRQPNLAFNDTTEMRGKIILSNCAFWGAGNWQSNTGLLSGVAESTGGDIEFYGCTFKVWQTAVARGLGGATSFKFVGCDFLDFRATSGATAHFLAATVAGSLMRVFLGGGNDFKGFFAVNMPGGFGEIYETVQPYTFDTPVIASADPLPIAAIGRSFVVSGAATFSYMNYPYKDRVVTLKFSGTAQVNDAGNFKLASPFVATPDDTLTLIADGVNWFEVSRSVN